MIFSNLNFHSCLPKIVRPEMALAVGVLMILAGAVRAQTLADLGATAPTPGANDIAQLSTAGNLTAPDGLNYYSNNHVDYHNGGEPGQTFTTGTNSLMLTSLSIKTGTSPLDSGGGGRGPGGGVRRASHASRLCFDAEFFGDLTL